MQLASASMYQLHDWNWLCLAEIFTGSSDGRVYMSKFRSYSGVAISHCTNCTCSLNNCAFCFQQCSNSLLWAQGLKNFQDGSPRVQFAPIQPPAMYVPFSGRPKGLMYSKQQACRGEMYCDSNLLFATIARLPEYQLPFPILFLFSFLLMKIWLPVETGRKFLLRVETRQQWMY